MNERRGIAIMQPYFLPYIGYWQLLNAVEKFVIFDDVNYINRGWVNRNYFLVNKSPTLLTVPLLKRSQNKKINEIEINSDYKWRTKILRTIELSYKKAPYFHEVFPLVNEVIKYEKSNQLTDYLFNSIELICNYLNCQTSITRTSTIYNNTHLNGPNRIVDIVEKEKETTYINAIGGKEIYNPLLFSQRGINLFFLETENKKIIYPQNTETYFSNLSIIDVLMNNSLTDVRQFLKFYKLIESKKILE